MIQYFNRGEALKSCLRPVMRFKHESAARKQASVRFYIDIAIMVILLLLAAIAHGEEPKIDMGRISTIESSGNPRAWRKADDSRGLYQITPIVLKEWNNFHPGQKRGLEDLWDPRINFEIADWYINRRIPQMLRHFKIPDTVENRIWAYNAGIGNVVKNRMPAITKNYLEKYFK